MEKKIERTVLVVAVLGSLLLLNVVGLSVFGRLDLTRDKQFTLSDATLRVLRDLKEPVTIRAYFTKDLPPPQSTNARYVKDLLEEYYAHASGNVRFEFIDPSSEETEADKEKKKDLKQDIFGRQIREATSVERELQALGIPPVQVRVNEADKLEVKRAYMGLSIQYADKKEVIPVISDTTGLEYDLTTLLRKVSRTQNPVVGVVTGHGGPSLHDDMGRMANILRELYDLREVDISKETTVPAEVEALLVVGPKTPFTDNEKRTLDTFVTSGHSAAFFLPPIKANLQTLQSEDNAPGLSDMLSSWGVTITPGLVLDAECATISVQQQAGFMRFNQPVRYPFMPLPKALANNDVTRGLSGVVLPFMGPVSVTVPEGGIVKADTLVQSSVQSWVQQPPYSLDPLQHWAAEPSQMAPHPLMVRLSGPVHSAFAKASDVLPQAGPEARVVVAAGDGFMLDPFFGKPNEALVLNLMDWLVRDDGLLAVRSRGLSNAALRDVGDERRNAVKYLNILGLPTAFVGFGLVRWRRREARRSQVGLDNA